MEKDKVSKKDNIKKDKNQTEENGEIDDVENTENIDEIDIDGEENDANIDENQDLNEDTEKKPKIKKIKKEEFSDDEADDEDIFKDEDIKIADEDKNMSDGGEDNEYEPDMDKCVYLEGLEEEKKVVEINKEDHVSIGRLTLFELAKIIGTREKQIEFGAKVLVSNINGLTNREIAIKELELGVCPFKIKRPFPNGMYEIHDVNLLFKNNVHEIVRNEYK